MKIRLLAMDVDGTLSDGRIYVGPEGETMKSFDVKDGYGILLFRRAGGIPVIITGRQSRIVEARCRELGVDVFFQNVGDKRAVLMDLAEKYGLEPEEIAYIGDDLNDLDCMSYAGRTACPADAVSAVRDAVDYVCTHDAGRGAVREFIDSILD